MPSKIVFLLTAEHGVADARVPSFRVHAEVDAGEELQFLRVLRAGQVQNQGDDPAGHGPLGQGLVHHVVAPVVLQEAGGDEQSPEVAVLHGPAQLRGGGPSRTLVPVLEEAPEAERRSLQEGHEPSGLFTVPLR